MYLRSAVTQAAQNKHPNCPIKRVEPSIYHLLLVTSVKSQLPPPPLPPGDLFISSIPSFNVGFSDLTNNDSRKQSQGSFRFITKIYFYYLLLLLFSFGKVKPPVGHVDKVSRDSDIGVDELMHFRFKVIYKKRFLFYVRIKYQFETSELKNSSSFIVLLE